MNDLSTHLDTAVASGNLLPSSAENIRQLLARSSSPVDRSSIEELVQLAAWPELNDRFFRTLAFGTGGLRGRTIGKIVTEAEAGVPQPLDRPEFPCVGTNAMNYFNISRATQGLVAYFKEHLAAEGRPGRPKLCIAHDHPPLLPPVCRAVREGRRRERLRRAAFQRAALDPGALIRRPPYPFRCRRRPHREPQPAA